MISALKDIERKTTRRAKNISLYTLEMAKQSQEADYYIEISKDSNGRMMINVHNKLSKSSRSIGYDFDEFKRFAEWIDDFSFRPSTYRNALCNLHFQILYQIKLRSVTYIEETPVNVKNEFTGPCMLCGLVLPLKQLSIDHKRPQTGGGNEAILKVFRVLGLTEEGPHGPKGLVLQTVFQTATKANNYQYDYKMVNSIPTKFNRQLTSGDRDDRYTLNEKGKVFYSLVMQSQHAGKLEEECLHNLVNLAPVCQSWNSGRGNPRKF